MAVCASISSIPPSLSISTLHPPRRTHRRYLSFPPLASQSSSAASPESLSSSSPETIVSSNPSSKPFSQSSKVPDKGLNYALASPSSNPVVRFVRSTESSIERIIFDFRFLALLAVGGSLAGSLLCFLNGCVYIVDAYKVYWSSCVKGIHTGQMVLRLVEAIGTPSSLKTRPLDGQLCVDKIHHAARDFGNRYQVLPLAVLHPKSVSDGATTIKHIGQMGPSSELTVAARGHAHSLQGQAQADRGVGINMEAFSGMKMQVYIGKHPYVSFELEESWRLVELAERESV